MAGYKERVTEDLDRWIAAGLVAADRREAILGTIPNARRLDAAAAIAWVGAILLGAAVIAFVAANWSAIPRLVRFSLILALFAAAAAAAAWTHQKGRPLIANGLLTFAAAVFAAAIGLTGQIFDIAGDPRSALLGAAVAAGALALAGRVTGPAIAALIFFGLSDFSEGGLFDRATGFDMPVLAIAAPAAGALAFAWRSTALAHAAAVGVIAACLWIAMRFSPPGAALLVMSLVLGGLAALGRLKHDRRGWTFYGWFAWSGLFMFALAGFTYAGHALDIAHRTLLTALSAALIALGRQDRHGGVTAAGVVGLMGAITAIMADLGLNLMAAAGLFFLMALAALAIGFVMARKKRA